MTKYIFLHLDEEIFNRLKNDKIKRFPNLTWEEYIARIFGFYRRCVR